MPRAPNGMPLAGFGDRLLAYLIDVAVLAGVLLLLAIPAMIGMFAIIGAEFAGLSTDPETGEIIGEPNLAMIFGPLLAVELGLVVLSMVAVYLYHVELFPNRRGVTLGKRAMKLRLIRLDNPAAPITRGVAAKRWAMQFLVGGVVPLFSWVDGLWQLWDKPYQQCLHDKVAETVVVKVST
ncbi:RDD family protein [Dactylosporangium fulvum]|uniref:RDD family protein n=1 Tax=Dactylosporangium fulvum TaxID=53359 RepID=A0ABY5W0G1_9ACTN|nr:RDD family protein [Dactylosporangium fulvum]UWP83007.1 RDD family protein [Dactylosporangium fulvum]